MILNYHNHKTPILVTLFGIVIDVKFEQLEKALLSILVTLFGIVIDVKLSQLAKAEFPMLVHYLELL